MIEKIPANSIDSIVTKIFKIRSVSVMLDRDLAKLFEVKAIRLREQVRRNMDKFPDHFMFTLTDDEVEALVSQNAIPSRQHLGGSFPFVFTEYGILQLANVLRSGKAIQMSIRIIEVFVRMRDELSSQKEIFQKIFNLEEKTAEQDKKILLIFEYLKQFEKVKQQELEFENRPKIGFRQGNNST